MNINISVELEKRVKELKRDEQSLNEIVEQIINLGCYQLEYRRKNNPKKSIMNKMMREVFNKVQHSPELSEKCGLGKRVEL